MDSAHTDHSSLLQQASPELRKSAIERFIQGETRNGNRLDRYMNSQGGTGEPPLGCRLVSRSEAPLRLRRGITARIGQSTRSCSRAPPAQGIPALRATIGHLHVIIDCLECGASLKTFNEDAFVQTHEDAPSDRTAIDRDEVRQHCFNPKTSFERW